MNKAIHGMAKYDVQGVFLGFSMHSVFVFCVGLFLQDIGIIGLQRAACHLFVCLFGIWVSESTNSYCIRCNFWFLQLGVVYFLVMEGQLGQKHFSEQRTLHFHYRVVLNGIVLGMICNN